MIVHFRGHIFCKPYWGEPSAQEIDSYPRCVGMNHAVPAGRLVFWATHFPGLHPGLFSHAPPGSNG
jgi:hypothetical protein